MNAAREYNAVVLELRAQGVPLEKAEARARELLTVDDRTQLDRQRERADTRREKAIEHEGDQLMLKRGFEVIKFSHPGKTRQTPGIPDRRYMRPIRAMPCRDHPGRFREEPAICVWVEYKSATGKQRPGQKLFQELAEACGEHYVLGGVAELRAWLREHVGL